MAIAFAIPSAIVGFSTDDALLLAISAGFMGLTFVGLDVAGWRHRHLSPMTLYSVMWVLTSTANVIAILNQDTSERSRYFIYAVDEHLPLAMKISWLGLVIPVLAFRWISRSDALRPFVSLMPRVSGAVPFSRLLPFCIGAAIFGIAAHVTRALPFLGTLTSIVYFLPHLAAFTLARAGVQRHSARAIWIAFAIAMAEAARALISAYLRSDIISPIFAYGLGLLMGARSLRPLRSVYMVPVYAAIVPFVIYFAAFAEAREQGPAGVARIAVIAETRLVQEEATEPPRHNLVTRFSSINQLTQVGRVVVEDGFLDGETLEYLTYAWIPRFLWPEKPVIAKGAWFALRIGQAHIRNGTITNSVNMTVPGELYLNFGWLGLLVGGIVFGSLIALLWCTTGFWSETHNILGGAFGFYLLWVGLGGGADLQIVVTLLAMFGLFLVASLAFPTPNSGLADAPRRGKLSVQAS